MVGKLQVLRQGKKGSSVIVTYENGLMKKSAVRFTITGPNLVLGFLQRIK